MNRRQEDSLKTEENLLVRFLIKYEKVIDKKTTNVGNNKNINFPAQN